MGSFVFTPRPKSKLKLLDFRYTCSMPRNESTGAVTVGSIQSLLKNTPWSFRDEQSLVHARFVSLVHAGFLSLVHPRSLCMLGTANS